MAKRATDVKPRSRIAARIPLGSRSLQGSGSARRRSRSALADPRQRTRFPERRPAFDPELPPLLIFLAHLHRGSAWRRSSWA